MNRRNLNATKGNESGADGAVWGHQRFPWVAWRDRSVVYLISYHGFADRSACSVRSHFNKSIKIYIMTMIANFPREVRAMPKG